MEDETEYFECECGSDEHRLIFTYEHAERDWPAGITASVFLHQYNGFWKRCWIAIKYIFGYKCKYGHFDTFMLRHEDAKRLKNLVDKLE